MKIITCESYDDMGREAANRVIHQVKNKPDSLICFPSGDSPAGMFKYLVFAARNESVDFNKCHFVGLDEWVGMGEDDEGSCTNFLHTHFFDQLQINPNQVYFFDAKATDLNTSCRLMDDFVKQHGPLDMMIVGIGMNGHIGLNEPGTDFNLYAHHAPLADITVTVGQKYFKQQTKLSKGITLGLKYLQEAKIPMLIAAGSKKAEIIEKALRGKVSIDLPASIFQMLPSAVILLDEAAASQLKML